MLRLFLQSTPIEEAERIMSYMVGFLQAMGLWNFVIGGMMALIILGLTFRLIDAVGGRK